MKTRKRWDIMGVPYNEHLEFYRNMEAVKKMTANAHKVATDATRARAACILADIDQIKPIEPMFKDIYNG